MTFYPNNQGIHTHHAMILLFRPETGEPLATMDGRLITEMRTAAVSAVATQLLARPEASVLAILGSGVQARSHLEALRLHGERPRVRRLPEGGVQLILSHPRLALARTATLSAEEARLLAHHPAGAWALGEEADGAEAPPVVSARTRTP